MRIISGSTKGKKILEPKDLNTRPLKDLTKESIFNILTHSNKCGVKIENSNILDLFAGVGSFGLECLSRGSSHVTFVENYKNVLPVLKKNVSNLDYETSSLIIENNITYNLNFKNFKKKFNVIFIDPPYNEKNVFIILRNIINAKILDDNGVIIIHRHKKERDVLPDEFRIIEEKTYGISRVFFGSYL